MTSDDSTPWENKNKKNTVNLAIWTGVWVASLALTSIGYKYIWTSNTLLSAIAIFISLVLGVSYDFLAGLNVIAQEADISVLIGFMGITYIITCLLGVREYQ